jgi:FKBP-type peptidyl-prolyl cis-trans isomerase FklB
MKLLYSTSAIILACTVSSVGAADHTAPAQPAGAPAPGLTSALPHIETLASETNRISYSIGVNAARNLQANFPSLNFEFFLLGLRDIYDAERLKLSEDQINASIARYNELSTAHVQKQVSDFKAVNLENAERFLEQNGKKEGVVTLPSGLQYRVLGKGQGPTPQPTGMAIVQFHGKALNGRTVESTLDGDKRGPATIELAKALPFLREALSQMPLGAKWELYVHPKLAYGDRGTERIAPNELLIYSLEVVGVQ